MSSSLVDISPTMWAVSIAALAAMFVLDFLVVDSHHHTFTQRKAARWVLFYIALALAFAGFAPAFASVTDVGKSPACRNCKTTSFCEAASIVPRLS